FHLPRPALLQRLVPSFQASPFSPPVLRPPQRFSWQLGPGKRVAWPTTASTWEIWSIELLVLSRALELKAELEPERVKMGSLPGWEIKAVGTAKWTLLPERHRVPKVFLDASLRTNFESVVGGAGLGFEFSGRWLKINFARTRAFDLDPEGMAGSD